MADTSPLAGLLDRADNVFRLAWQLGWTFQQEREGAGRQRDPYAWDRHQPAFNEFCAAVLDLQDAMQNPPEGFATVARELLNAAAVARQIRDAMKTSDGRWSAAFLDFFPHLNSVNAFGREALREVTKARRQDDPFAFLDQPASGKEPGIDTSPTLPKPPPGLIESAARAIPEEQNEGVIENTKGSKRRKRSTERGEGREKLIAALTKHHQYAEGSCLNMASMKDPLSSRLVQILLSRSSSATSSSPSASVDLPFVRPGRWCEVASFCATSSEPEAEGDYGPSSSSRFFELGPTWR